MHEEKAIPSRQAYSNETVKCGLRLNLFLSSRVFVIKEERPVLCHSGSGIGGRGLDGDDGENSVC